MNANEPDLERGLERGRVSLDEHGPWPAMIPPRRWNGWGCPYFDRQTADAIADYVNAEAAREPDVWQTRIDRDGDAYIMRDFTHGGEFDDRIEPVEIDGVPHYQIGNGWCWWVCDDDDDDDDDDDAADLDLPPASPDYVPFWVRSGGRA